MPVEIPILLPPFSEQPLGIPFADCLANIYSLDARLFPTTLPKTTKSLAFQDLTTGEDSIKRWIAGGILKIGGEQFNRAEIGLLKLTQVIIFQSRKRIAFERVRQCLFKNLAGTEFEPMIGKTEIVGQNLRGKVTLLFPEDPWYIAIDELTKSSNRVVRYI